MYVRKKFMRRGEKTYGPYWQVVRSRRIDGKPRQEVVANLRAVEGIAPPEDREEADTLARAKGLLCAVRGCGEAATVELTWRGWRGHTTPVDVTLRNGPFSGKKCGYLVCPDHLEEWHSKQLDHYPQDFPRVIPLLFPPERSGKLRT